VGVQLQSGEKDRIHDRETFYISGKEVEDKWGHRNGDGNNLLR